MYICKYHVHSKKLLKCQVLKTKIQVRMYVHMYVFFAVYKLINTHVCILYTSGVTDLTQGGTLN